MLLRDPDRAQRIITELREELDEVRGTALESDYARALPAFEPHLPADQWQLHFGDIDPTPVAESEPKPGQRRILWQR